MVNSEGLTPKQAIFVESYLSNGNATEAARVAGYSQSSLSAIGSQATENLHKPAIVHAIKARQGRITASLALDADVLAEELATMAFAPISKEVSASDKRQAISELARMAGLFVDRRQVEVAQRVELTVTVRESD
jgi:phage terminase small subunit